MQLCLDSDNKQKQLLSTQPTTLQKPAGQRKRDSKAKLKASQKIQASPRVSCFKENLEDSARKDTKIQGGAEK